MNKTRLDFAVESFKITARKRNPGSYREKLLGDDLTVSEKKKLLEKITKNLSKEVIL